MHTCVNVSMTGAFGLVQKGSLSRDGKLTTVAVKLLKGIDWHENIINKCGTGLRSY